MPEQVIAPIAAAVAQVRADLVKKHGERVADSLIDSKKGGVAQKYDRIGLALEASGAFSIALGSGERVATFPLTSVTKVHAKFMSAGKVGFEVLAGNQPRQILVSKSEPRDLVGIMKTLDEASRHRGLSVLCN